MNLKPAGHQFLHSTKSMGGALYMVYELDRELPLLAQAV